MYTALSILLTFCFVSFCWVFFRADSFGTAMQILTAVFTWQRGMTHISSWTVFGILVIAAAMMIACIRSKRLGTKPEGYYPIVSLNSVWGLALLFAALGLTLVLAYTGETPFIYAQF